ncbi:MAG: mechanosensitive ion channel family protein [Mycoplasmatales bacterium]
MLHFIINKLIWLLFTVICYLILLKVVLFINHILCNKTLIKKKKARRETIISLIDNVLRYIIGILFIIALLLSLGFSTTAVLTITGAISIVLGIAGKELITDVINGFFTVLEGYYDVGDYIKVNQYEGFVLSLKVRATTIKTYNGEIVTIPNSQILEIINYSKSIHTIYLDILTPYEKKVNNIKKLLSTKVLEKIKNQELVSDAEYLGINDLASSGVEHRFSVSCKPNDRFAVEREVHMIIVTIFEKEKIQVPYNKISISKDK